MIMTDEGSEDVAKAIANYAKAYDVTLDESFPLDWFLKFRAYYERNRNGDEVGVLIREYLRKAPSYEGILDDAVEPEELEEIMAKEKEEAKAKASEPKSPAPDAQAEPKFKKMESAPANEPSSQPEQSEPPSRNR